MSDNLAQPTTGLAHRLVGDPNSMIGALIKRGATGTYVADVSLKKNSGDDALDTLERVLDEVEQTSPLLTADAASEGLMTQVMPQVMAQTADLLDTTKQMSSATQKEKPAPAISLEQVATDAAGGVQTVEAVPTPEISPEVESYLQKVEDTAGMAPKEIVIADGTQTAPVDHQYPSQPVVVLPITKEQEEAGAKKNPKFSIRWLVEWSRRLMKIFFGKVIYRPVEGTVS